MNEICDRKQPQRRRQRRTYVHSHIITHTHNYNDWCRWLTIVSLDCCLISKKIKQQQERKRDINVTYKQVRRTKSNVTKIQLFFIMTILCFKYINKYIYNF